MAAIVPVATLMLLSLFVGIGVYGVVLLRRPGRRLVGGLLLVEALLAVAAQVALSTLPFGIGDPLVRVQFWATLAQTAGSIAAIGAMIALVYLLGRNFPVLLARARRPWLINVALLLLVPLIAVSSLYALVKVSLPERERERDPLKRQIAMAAGFEWSVYAQGTMDNPTAIAFAPDGKLFVADIAGNLWLASDGDGDHKVERIAQWAGGFQLLVGLVWHGDELFAASSGKIEALRDSDGDGVADQRRLVVGNLPSMILMPHSNNGLAFGPDGRLYFGVGATTDGNVERHELAAAILSVNPDGSDLRVYARGLGNSFDVAFNRDGELFAGDNGPSSDGNGGDPPDEFNHIIEGGFYGYPYFYGDPPGNRSARGALASFPPHSAPTGLTFYQGTQFPPEYRDSGFITLWRRGEIARVEVARTASGSYLSRTSTFGSGFLYPIDVVTGPDGNLYVADFGTSAIYRITFNPNSVQ